MYLPKPYIFFAHENKSKLLNRNLTVLKISDQRSLTVLHKAHYVLYALTLLSPLYNSPQGIFLGSVFSFQLNSQTLMSSTLLFIGYRPDSSSLCLLHILIIFLKKHLGLKKMSTKFPLISNCLRNTELLHRNNIFLTHQKLGHI